MILHLGPDSREKRTRIYREILKAPSATIITAEQATLDLERDIIDSLDLAGLLFHQVTSFSRLLSQGLDYFGEKNLISDVGRLLILRQVLEEKKDQLPLYGGSFKKEGFYEELLRSFNLFDRGGVDPGELLELEPEGRLHELGLIYEGYQERLSGESLYEAQALEVFEGLPRGAIYSKDQVFILGYKTLDYIQWRMLAAINKNAQVHFVLDSGEGQAYSSTERTRYMLERAYSCRVLDYDSGKSQAYYFAKELLEEEGARRELAAEVFSARDPYVEAEFIGLHILRRMKEDPSLSYRDFKVLVSDMESYDSVFRQVFTELSLPLFSDRRRSILESPMVRSFLALLRALQKGLRREEILAFLKGFLPRQDWEDLDRFENHCFSRGLGGRAFREGFEDPDMDLLRRRFLASLLPYEDKLRKKHRTGDFEVLIKELLDELGFAKRLEEEALDYQERGQNEEAQLLLQLWDSLVELLGQLSSVGPKEALSFRDYIGLLEASLAKMSLGVIPPAIDSIRITTLFRASHEPVNYLYFAGLNQGLIPREYSEDLLLREEDKRLLQERGYLVYDNFENKEELDRLDLLSALSLVERGYFFSYVLTDLKGKSRTPSIFIERILERTEAKFYSSAYSDSYLKDFYPLSRAMSFRYGLRAIREAREEVVLGLSDEELRRMAQALVAGPQAGPLKREEKKLYTSISSLERYRLCPFRYFVQDDLRARKRKAFKIDAMDLGNFFHEIMERALADYIKGLYKLEELRDYLKELSEKTLEASPDYQAFKATAAGGFLFRRSLITLEALIGYLIEHSDKSSFRPRFFEESFTIERDNYIFRGIIDRVDVMEDKFLAIDYKTGGKSFDLNRVFQGIDLQLILYIDGFTSLEPGYKPSGVYYFRLHDPMGSPGSKRESQLQLDGVFIGDEDLARSYDPSLGQGLLPLRVKNTGGFYSSSKVLSPDQAERLLERSRNFSQTYVDRILAGSVEILPLYDDKAGPGFTRACDYCDFRAICRFDPRALGASYSSFEKLSDKEIREELDEMDS